MGPFDTAVLQRVVEDLEQPASFILDSYFPNVQTSDTEEIWFDVDESKPRITPFVHPTKAGIIVDDGGYSTKSFKPAYAKDKRVFNGSKALKRSIGETIGGNLNASQRNALQLRNAMVNQLEMLTRREEVMATEAMLTGKVTVSGEGYPEAVVDFGRDAALTLSLAGVAKWDQANIKRIDNLEDWASLIQEKSGAVSTRVTMDPKAWRLLKNDEEVQKLLEYRRGTSNTINVDPMARGQAKARYVGTLGDFDLYVYQDRYINDAGVMTQMLPDNTIILGGGQMEGTRGYGVIQDEKSGFSSARYFTKSWMVEDPAVRYLLMQSAPLVFPYRPNASMAITVA